MPILDLEDSQAKKPVANKPLKLVLGAGVLVGALALGSTFAANINLNGGGNVEFGQGVATTTACDEDGITVTPFSTFTNAPDAGAHKMSTISISGINSTSCDGKTFRIKAYGDGDSPLDLFEYKVTTGEEEESERVVLESKNHNSIEVNAKIENTSPTFTWSSGGTDGDDVIEVDNSNPEQTAFTLNFVSSSFRIARTPLAYSEDVQRITVETIDTTCLQGVGCQVGDVGPGGGIVYYVAQTGEEFYCGPTREMKCRYLEAAPSNWDQGYSDPVRPWSGNTNLATAYGESLGYGYSNSLFIQTQVDNVAANSAAVLARQYPGGGKSDWYLPSQDEVNKMCIWVRGQVNEGICSTAGEINTGVGAAGFSESGYWSSTESDPTFAKFSSFSGGGMYTLNKPLQYFVRPVRAFGYVLEVSY